MIPHWVDADFARAAKPAAALLWRGVEAQHRVATMRLVDTLAEQAELERILEQSKPPLPPAAQGLHYLLAAPFRYRSPHPSRFRAAADPGVWYGAQDKPTACAEVGYWRWRFLMDSAGLRGGELITEHTLFQAQVRGAAIDLERSPWSAQAAAWRDPHDHAACQALARAARAQGGVQWIRYDSVRRPGGRCGAVLDPACLALPAAPAPETWVCKVSATRALMLHGDEGVTIEIDAPAG